MKQKSETKKVSAIVPVFNEESTLKDCLNSLKNQSYKNLEIIVVDDGSTDNSLKIAKEFNIDVLKQNHSGPGNARNAGADKSQGEILVFADADMTFDKDFVSDLVKPIIDGKTIGTFSKNERVSNAQNVWSICWNINKNLPKTRMIPDGYPNKAPVFRAISKKEFLRVGGFDQTGEYTDDWSLSKKLKVKSTLAQGAVYFHSNPATLWEVYKQTRWIGKNFFISGNLLRKFKSLLLYNPLASLVIGIYKGTRNRNLNFIIFKIVYDFAILTSVIKSMFGEPKYK